MSGDPRLVREVTDVSISILEKEPPILVVQASGNVPTGGWTNPGLSRVVYVTEPADGIQDYEFMATPPSGMATDMFTPVHATDSWDNPPDWLKGVRVKAASNSMEEAVLLADT
jgi:hypothetical protein